MTVSFVDVEAAAARIRPFVLRTPVLASRSLDEWLGTTAFVKAEHLQRAGAFKYRGATNAVQSLPAADAARGVAAHSSGNHATALALAASARGIAAYVVIPRDARPAKVAAVEGYGARITFCESSLEAREATLREVLDETGAVEVHPFDDERVIAGAGTAALELCEDAGRLDVVVTPVGGGGLGAGTCIAVHGLRPDARVIGAEPADRSSTIADGLRTGCSRRTAAILRDHGVDVVGVVDDAIVDAMRVVRDTTEQAIEPSAAVAFAAVRRLGLSGARVGIICSGGNVDVDPREAPVSGP